MHMGGCQNYDPFLGAGNIRGRIIVGVNFDNRPYAYNDFGNFLISPTMSQSPYAPHALCLYRFLQLMRAS